MKGYVYVIKEEHGLIKIGFSNNVVKRFATLNQIIPYKLELLCYKYCDDPKTFEQNLHEMFHKCRKHGEWFRLDNKQIKYLERIMDNPNRYSYKSKENVALLHKFWDSVEDLNKRLNLSINVAVARANFFRNVKEEV